MPSRARAPRSSDAYIWDLCALLTGFIGATALAAEVDTMNFVWVWFMPVIGLSASTAALVGNAIGAGHPQHARRVLWTCVLLDCAVWATTAAIVYAARWPIAALLTSDPRIQALIAPCLAIYCLAGFADSAQNVMAGGLRGLGKQDFGAGVILGCFWLVLLPLAALLVFAIPPPSSPAQASPQPSSVCTSAASTLGPSRRRCRRTLPTRRLRSTSPCAGE